MLGLEYMLKKICNKLVRTSLFGLQIKRNHVSRMKSSLLRRKGRQLKRSGYVTAITDHSKQWLLWVWNHNICGDFSVCREKQIVTIARSYRRENLLQWITVRKWCLYLMSHPASHIMRREWEFKFGNIRKTAKNGNFKRHFLQNGWSYGREILNDY